MGEKRKRIFYVVNVDWFFLSHRLPLAIEAQRRGYEVIVITKNTGAFEQLESNGIHCIHLQIGRGYRNLFAEIRGFIRLCRIYRKYKPDLIHHITIKFAIYGSVAAALFSRKSAVINAITGLGYAFSSSNRYLARSLIKVLMLIAFFRKRKLKFIFQNGDDYGIFSKLGVLREKNTIIIKGAGVDENKFKKNFVTKELHNRLRIILVSRMLRDKGIFEYVSAARRLKPELFGQAEFIMVGGVDHDNPSAILEKDLLSLTDEGYISWLGHRSDITDVYNTADIACLPSYREGLPKSLIEAMSMECPIVTTDTPGCRECVEDGVNGFLVPVGDHIILSEKLLKLCESADLRHRMGKASRDKMIKEMSLKKVVERTFDFYEI